MLSLKTFALDSDTNDLVFDGQNNIRMVNDSDEKEQSLRLLLNTNKGEFFLDIEHGLAYEHIFVKQPNLERIRAELLLALEQEERIDEVNDVDVQFDHLDRKLTVTFSVQMDGEEITSEEVIET